MGNSSSGVAEIKGKSDVANLNAALAAREAANHAAGSANNMRRSVSSKRFKKGGDGATQWRVSACVSCVLLQRDAKRICNCRR
jgi:hypothetical protein